MDEVLRLLSGHLKIISWRCDNCPPELSNSIECIDTLVSNIGCYLLFNQVNFVPLDIITKEDFYELLLRNNYQCIEPIRTSGITAITDITLSGGTEFFIRSREDSVEQYCPSVKIVDSKLNDVHRLTGTDITEFHKLNVVYNRVFKYMKRINIRTAIIYYMALTDIYDYAHFCDGIVCLINNVNAFSNHLNAILALFNLDVKDISSWFKTWYTVSKREKRGGICHMVNNFL